MIMKGRLRVMAKKTVGILFGGRSSEHEVSLRSAEAVFKQIDKSLYEVKAIGIDREGRWYLDQNPPVLSAEPSKEVRLPLTWAHEVPVLEYVHDANKKEKIDLFFPVLHGPLYEDGAIQGVFELTNVPFAGAGVMGSSLAMHKDVSKQLLSHHGIPIVPAIAIDRSFWKHSRSMILDEAKKQMDYPLFVKPNNMGSSIGVHKVATEKELVDAIKDAFQYDEKVLLEQGVDAREIEFSVLENLAEDKGPLVSAPGEIILKHGFYSYQAKYIEEDGAKLIVPTHLEKDILEKAQKIAAHSFDAIGCEGMARVDLFIDKKTGEIFVNELNTLPGFTSISMYPKLWEASGVSFPKLLNHLIQLGLMRHEKKQKLKRDWQ